MKLVKMYFKCSSKEIAKAIYIYIFFIFYFFCFNRIHLTYCDKTKKKHVSQ